MGLGDFFKSLFGKEEQKTYEPPDVKFIDDVTSNVTHTIPITVEVPKHQIIIRKDDHYYLFESEEDIPAELKDEISHIEELSTDNSYSVIVDGQRQVYSKYEEIPEEIRDAIKNLDVE